MEVERILNADWVNMIGPEYAGDVGVIIAALTDARRELAEAKHELAQLSADNDRWRGEYESARAKLAEAEIGLADRDGIIQRLERGRCDGAGQANHDVLTCLPCKLAQVEQRARALEEALEQARGAMMDIADALGCGKHPPVGHVERAKQVARDWLTANYARLTTPPPAGERTPSLSCSQCRHPYHPGKLCGAGDDICGCGWSPP